MLVLTRRELESIRIGDDIALVVINVKGNQVRFGVQAPRQIAVDREEIRRLKDKKKKEPDKG